MSRQGIGWAEISGPNPAASGEKSEINRQQLPSCTERSQGRFDQMASAEEGFSLFGEIHLVQYTSRRQDRVSGVTLLDS